MCVASGCFGPLLHLRCHSSERHPVRSTTAQVKLERKAAGKAERERIATDIDDDDDDDEPTPLRVCSFGPALPLHLSPLISLHASPPMISLPRPNPIPSCPVPSRPSTSRPLPLPSLPIPSHRIPPLSVPRQSHALSHTQFHPHPIPTPGPFYTNACPTGPDGDRGTSPAANSCTSTRAAS